MLDTRTSNQLKKILFQYIDPNKHVIFLFGSRAQGTNKPYSDIDIGIEGKKPLTLRTLALLQDAFEESNLPYTIDVIDFATVSERFKTIAKKQSIILN